MKYNKYQEYKSLSFPFLDKIPAEWMVVPLYALSNFRQGKLHEPYIDENGKFICINSRFVSTEGKKFKHCSVNLSPVKKSDILMVMSDLPNGRALAKALFVKGENNYALNQRVCAITPTNIYPKFLYYQLNRNAYFLSFDDGSNQTNLSNYDFKKYPVLLPSEEEQKTIANYLDSTTAKIDTLIEKQTKLIALLKEKRQAVISTAVTRGLDNTVAMKDSGVEWLGEIPEHWEVKKLKYISSVNDDSLPDNTSDELEINYIDIGSVTTGYIQNYETMSYGNAPSRARRIIKDGDILVSTVRTYLKAIAPVSSSYNNYIASTGFAVIRSGKELNTNFTKYALLSNYFIDLVESCSVGVSYPAINASDLVTFRISLPSIEEQKEIALYLDTKTSKIDTLITKATKAINLLREKRTALISLAVTGKIKVNGEIREDTVKCE